MPKIMIIDHPNWITKISSHVCTDRYTIVAKLSHLSFAKEVILREQPDLVLLDYSAMRSDNQTNLIQSLHSVSNSRLILLHHSYISDFDFQDYPNIVGLICKTYLDIEMDAALAAGTKNYFYLSPRFTRKVFDTQHIKAQEEDRYAFIHLKFSTREMEVLQLILQQQTNQEIADRLGISRRTVEVHKRNLIMKAGAKNIVGLVMFCAKNDLLTLELEDG